MQNYYGRKLYLILSGLMTIALLSGCQGGMRNITVPSGTSVVVALQSSLSTENASEGQAILAETTEPIIVEGTTVAPSGTVVRGFVTSLTKPGNVKDGAELTLDFKEILMEGNETYEFDAAPITLKAKSDADSDIERLAAGTVAGAIIGGIAEGGEGAAVGALIGAGAGGTWAVVTKGDHIVLDPGQKFRIETTESTDLPVKESK